MVFEILKYCYFGRNIFVVFGICVVVEFEFVFRFFWKFFK